MNRTARSAWLAAAALALAAGGSCARAETPPGAPPIRSATAATILEEVRRPGARAVLVNVWATWCLPCREEFPDLVALDRAYRDRGLRTLLVSADFEDDREAAVRRFLAGHGAQSPAFLKEGGDQEFIDAIEPRWSGALPATLLYDGAGARRGFWEGRATYEELERKVLEILGSGTRASASEPNPERTDKEER